MLAGVSKKVNAQLDRTEITQETLSDENIFIATENVGAATKAAWFAVGPGWRSNQN